VVFAGMVVVEPSTTVDKFVDSVVDCAGATLTALLEDAPERDSAPAAAVELEFDSDREAAPTPIVVCAKVGTAINISAA
jgi:hypothetical protein